MTDSPFYRTFFAARNVLPALVILVFSLAALYSTVQLLDEQDAIISRYQHMSHSRDSLEFLALLEALQDRHDEVFWSVFIMGLSGFVLIIVLIERVARLRQTDLSRRKMVGLLEERMAAIAAALDGICISDKDGRIVYVNDSLLRMYGYGHVDELQDQSWATLYNTAQCARFTEDVLPVLQTKGIWEGQATGLRKDGSAFVQSLSVTLLADGGQIRVMRDVSPQMEAESLSRRRLAALAAAGDGIGIVDESGRLIYMNRALMDLHGMSDSESYAALGKLWEDLYTGEGRAEIRRDVLPALRKQGYWCGESLLARRDGKRVWAEMSLTLLPDGGYIGTARDISERKRAELEKADLQAQIAQSQKMEAIGRLAGGIAHDFNNIIAAIMGYAEFLEEDLAAEPSKRRFAANILQAASQARYLVDQMLSFSRRKESRKMPVNLNAVVQDTIPMIRASLTGGIDIETLFTPEETTILANPTQIAQAIMNLCVNARDAMEQDGGVLRVTTSLVEADEDQFEGMLKPDDEGDVAGDSAVIPLRLSDPESGCTSLELGTLCEGRTYVCLSVSDTGTGMARAIMEHIFEPFFTTKPVDKGTGLGLSNVHGIIADHTAALTIESRLGQGTRFDLYFPCIFPCAETSVPESGDSVDISGTPTGSGRILLVEDKPHVRDMITTILTRLGYEVCACENGLRALERLTGDEPFDVVITDYNMPRMTGVELATQSHLHRPELPFLLISGESMETLESLARDHPAIRATLRKPIDRKELAACLSSLITQRKANTGT